MYQNPILNRFGGMLLCPLSCDPLYGPRGSGGQGAPSPARSSLEYNASGYKTIGYNVDRHNTLCYEHNAPWRGGADTDQVIGHQGNRLRGLPKTYRPEPLSKAQSWEGSVPFLQISPYLILSVLALTLTPGILGGNYFPAFPPTCPAWRTGDNADE